MIACEPEPKPTNYMKYLIKLDRFAAWLLFISLILYFISGYGMTKGLISPQLATSLHISYLTYFVLLAFVIHTSFAIHLAFKRWRIWNGFGKFIFILFYLTFIIGFVYVDRFYKKPNSSVAEPQPAPAVSQIKESDDEVDNDENVSPVSSVITPSPAKTPIPIPAPAPTPTPTTSQTKTFNTAELAKYNGKNGQPSYLAISGVVYDVSSKFINGAHNGCSAGRDVTNAFYAVHIKAIVKGFPVVGNFTP